MFVRTSLFSANFANLGGSSAKTECLERSDQDLSASPHAPPDPTRSQISTTEVTERGSGELYGVETKRLNEAIKRNIDRFPEDFMFQLGPKDLKNLKSQFATSKTHPSVLRFQLGTSNSRGGRRTAPYAFTEQGIAMLSSVLRSPIAVEVNIAIMRTFVQLRRLMDSNDMLADNIENLEKKYNENFKVVFEAIRQLIKQDTKPKRQIGFRP